MTQTAQWVGGPLDGEEVELPSGSIDVLFRYGGQPETRCPVVLTRKGWRIMYRPPEPDETSGDES